MSPKWACNLNSLGVKVVMSDSGKTVQSFAPKHTAISRPKRAVLAGNGLRTPPFELAICAVSLSETAHIAMWNAPFRVPKRRISQNRTLFLSRHFVQLRFPFPISSLREVLIFRGQETEGGSADTGIMIVRILPTPKCIVPSFSKDNASERQESLLSFARAQLGLCKGGDKWKLFQTGLAECGYSF